MSKEITMQKSELVKLVELCDKFATNTITVEYIDGGGIGYFLNAKIITQIKDEVGTFVIEVSGVDNW